ncbi:Putative myc-type, basic helix-loop-helix (bHLH) domain-containing protein [Septoria linicola]|uniref:Myc-type, basic helix-loop-helix (BHLH) domain-containing protein n=1 Tax=Septoria linicola TaxID=215465 RepID=A0A9Q9ACN1_9PEZI|nr:putative myc-type, basic helix-loop-helix (bHLH) domain-containing protein [Septoria linicola]USW47104.1 Putative myc-type, basic helix-loop-helix (bHLH) domain-containing protein [Septoria linicola]
MASSGSQQQQQQQQHGQGLPSISSLTNGLPRTAPISPDGQSLTDSTRDSGTWPQPQSKHNSANSQGLQVHTLLNPDDSPSRHSIPSTPLSARLPGSMHGGGSQLPSINQGFQDGPNRDSYPQRDSLGRELNRDSYRDSRDLAPHLDSRRSSVDSRMHQGFNSLYINGPASPYESANTSQVSLAASLRRPNGAPLSPLSARSSQRGHPAPRIAPPIMPVGRGPGVPDPTAAKPTQGYAWAFPDGPIPEEERRGSDSGESSNTGGPSRQNSFAASSIRSSIFSTDSQMPMGQRRFTEDEAATTHHHSLQHRTISGLQHEAMPPQGIGNYSRTPELRVSHKLAERKRRSEMKDLFEDLNKAVPSNGGTKASKWEILTKAIEYTRSQQHAERTLHAEVQRLQRDNEFGRETHKENDMLRTEIQVMREHLRRLEPNAPHIYGHFTSSLNAQQSQGNGAPGIALPPLNTASNVGQGPQGPASYNGGPAAAAMQGVEYGAYGR